MQIGSSAVPDRVPDPTSTDPGAQTSGAGFDRMIAAAQAEADRRKAIAAQSGAGADQFSEQGWLQVFKAHGAEIGYAGAAQAITRDSHGQLTILDPALRAKVLNYRNDTVIRALMAVKRSTDGKAVLNAELGRQPSDAEKQVADAIGGKAAAKLILTRQSTPNASAAIVVPEAAKADRALFYRPDGSPQTVNEVLVKLMKPSDGASQQAPAVAGTPVPLGKGLTPEMAAALRARTALASATAPATPGPKAKARPGPPPDLALVTGTIGNLSIPGSARGPTAPTGGKLTGWRSQLAGEVTHQVEHPESVVTNLPSNVTIAAPQPGQRPVANAVAVAKGSDQTAAPSPVQPTPPTAETQMLGPSLVPTPATTVPAAPLPQLVSGLPDLPATALPLLPIGASAASTPAAGPGTAPSATAAPIDPSPADPGVALVAVRPSRYGPRIGQAPSDAPAMTLNYATSGSSQVIGTADASAAGIRPSRLFAGAAIAAQQFASNGPATQQVSAMVGQGAYAQSAPPQSPNMAPVSVAPVDAMSVLGPDGVPVLPPVPPRSGLAPISAAQAMQPGPLDQAALFSGTKPLDLAPPVQAAAAAAAPAPSAPRQRPRTVPAFLHRS